MCLYQNLKTGELVDVDCKVEAMREFGLGLSAGRHYVMKVKKVL